MHSILAIPDANKTSDEIFSGRFGPPDEIGIVGLPPNASPGAWAARIAATFAEGVKAIIDTGRVLIAAKSALPHGEFGRMIDSELPFTARTAQMLMGIARDSRLVNAKFVSRLPPSWGTLYELTKWTDEELDAAHAAGNIHPEITRRDAIRGARAIMASRIEPADSLDYAPTPPWSARALFCDVLPNLGFPPSIIALQSALEPACGEGHLAEVAREFFPSVRATDVRDYGYGDGVQDFLANDYKADADWIVTNPPFGEKAESFAIKAISQARIGTAIFARLQWLEGVGRYEKLFRGDPPTQIAFFCERVNLCMGRWDPDGSTATAYIWLVWIKGQSSRPPAWIPPGRRKALTKPDDRDRFTAHPVKHTDRLAVPALSVSEEKAL